MLLGDNMFWWLWNYLRGYVIIKVTGFSTERFINLAVLNGIDIWDIKYISNARIMKAGLKNFQQAYKCSERCGCKIEILKQCGLTFSVKKIWSKKLFAWGIAAFSLLLFAFTRFIWVVETEGNERVTSRELLEFCSDNNVSPGRLKYKADLKDLSRKIILQFEEIGWAAVNIKGTKVVVSVAENIEKPEVKGDIACCSNIEALKDGVVESIMVESGTALVKAGDVVEKGDILIKGEIILKDGETEYARKYEDAAGSVMAKTVYSFKTEAEKKRTDKKYTGEKKVFCKITVNDSEIIFFKPKEDNFDTSAEKDFELSLGGFVLPVKIELLAARFYNEKVTELTDEEVKMLLKSRIEEKKEEIFSASSYITEENTVVSDGKDALKAETRLLVIEDIGKKVKTENIQGEFVTDGSQ